VQFFLRLRPRQPDTEKGYFPKPLDRLVWKSTSIPESLSRSFTAKEKGQPEAKFETIVRKLQSFEYPWNHMRSECDQRKTSKTSKDLQRGGPAPHGARCHPPIPASAISTEAITAGKTTKRKKRPQATPIASQETEVAKLENDHIIKE